MSRPWPPVPDDPVVSQGWDPSGFNRNPPASVPGPMPAYTVPGSWAGPTTHVHWDAGEGNVIRRARWKSPVFDLRPEFKGAFGGNLANTQPVWRSPYGAGGRLYIFISNFSSFNYGKTGLRVTSTEFAHPSDAQKVEQFNEPEDVTVDYAGPQPAGVSIIVPPGEGYPIRFWQCRLVIDYLVANATDVPLTVAGAYY